MKKKVVLAVLGALIALYSCQKKAVPPAPYGALPSQAQLDWQDMQYYMFIHFGPNTFTDVEWGDGKEDPQVFNPTNIDVNQWADIAKKAGMKGIILTSKHHDGFCLWPSKYSTHTVRESPWKDGQGDLLKDLSEACKKAGLKFGVYLSPWDQNHPSYGTPEYNQIFVNTLTEVLTQYGEIFEVWFDGANGEGHGGKNQVYDWNLFQSTVYKYQPNAIIFSDIGPGCRWIGNENGYAGKTNWSRLDTIGFGPGKAAPPTDTLNMGNVYGKAWVPGEADVSIRPGWFYSSSTDNKVKTLEQLVTIYYSSVGRNANLLLNVPPGRNGRIHPNDSIRLMEFKAFLDKAFENNLALGMQTTASNVRGNNNTFSALNLTDGKKDTYWATDDNVLKASVEITFPKLTKLNRVSLEEVISLGQRVSGFTIEGYNEELGRWEFLANGTTIGAKRILSFPTVETKGLRINIDNSLASPILRDISVYLAPEFLSTPQISRSVDGMITIKCKTPDPTIYYTTDGSEPSLSSKQYKTPFALSEGGEVRAIASINDGEQKSEVVSKNFGIAPANWQINEKPITEFKKIVDGNSNTIEYFPMNTPLQLDLGQMTDLKGFVYIPAPSVDAPNIYRFNLYVADKSKKWKKLKSNATFTNIKNNPIAQTVLFDKSENVQYVKFEPLELVNQSKDYSIAGFDIITK